MDTRDEPGGDHARGHRPAATRRAFLAGAAALLGTAGAASIRQTAVARRRARKNNTRNKNQSSATSRGEGGDGGGGGDAGAVIYDCDPDFQNCVLVNGVPD